MTPLVPAPERRGGAQWDGRKGCFSWWPHFKMDVSVLPVLLTQSSSLCSVYLFTVLTHQCITPCTHLQCNISSHSVTRSTMQRWQQAVMTNPSKKVCIECQPIVLSKTMINLGRCCFHHNRHHPVRTVVAYQTMSVLKVSCPYSTLQAAATVHFLPIWYRCRLPVAPSYVSGGNFLHCLRLWGNCWVCWDSCNAYQL